VMSAFRVETRSTNQPGRGLTPSMPRPTKLELPDEPVQFSADPLRVPQILSNLLTNAAKYTDPGGSHSPHWPLRSRRNQHSGVRYRDRYQWRIRVRCTSSIGMRVYVRPTTLYLMLIL
jgi:signal transduction histidine kinase